MRLEIPFAHYWRVTLADGDVTRTFPCYAKNRDHAIIVARQKWKHPHAVVKEAVKMRNY